MPSQPAPAGEAEASSRATRERADPSGVTQVSLPPQEAWDDGAPNEERGHRSFDELTPLPPPLAQASLITGRNEHAHGVAAAGRAPHAAAPVMEDDEPRSATIPLPLPPAPTTGKFPGPQRSERSMVPSRRLALGNRDELHPLSDPADSAWTLALSIAGASLGTFALVASLAALVAGVRAGERALWTLGLVAVLAAIFPLLALARRLMVLRIRACGIAVGPSQLPEVWASYLTVTERLGVPLQPLYIYDFSAEEAWLVQLAQTRVVVLPRSACASTDAMVLALARALGSRLAGHGSVLDVALMLPLRLLGLGLLPLRVVGLGWSPLIALHAARVYTTDRAACVGAGQLGLVVDEILGGGDPLWAANVDLAAIEAQAERLKLSALARLWLSLSAPRPSVITRVVRLQRFVAAHAPHL